MRNRGDKGPKIDTDWWPEVLILTTELHGMMTESDIAQWEQSLDAALSECSSPARFKLLFDLSGYEPQSPAVHRRMRGVVPQLLLSSGLVLDFVRLLAEEALRSAGVTDVKEQQCVAFARVHHDFEKMNWLDTHSLCPRQRYFAGRGQAEDWLKGFVFEAG